MAPMLMQGQLKSDPPYIMPFKLLPNDGRLGEPFPHTKNVRTGCLSTPLRSLSQAKIGQAPLGR